MKEIWRPSVTVAAVIEQDESLIAACLRGNNFPLELLSKAYG